MPTVITAYNTQAPWYSPVLPIVTRGLVGWFTFDTDASRFGVNRVLGASAAVVFGAPTAYATHGRFKGNVNYINTGIKETTEMTLIAVCRAVSVPTGAADGIIFVGNIGGSAITPGYEGLSAFGVSIYMSTPDVLSGSACRDNGSGSTTSAGATISNEVQTDWAIRAVITAQVGGTIVKNLTQGTSGKRDSTATRVLSDAPFLIGSAPTSYTGESDISAVAVYSVALTDDEIAKVASQMRIRTTRLGLSV
jgi:hypothetical protein